LVRTIRGQRAGPGGQRAGLPQIVLIPGDIMVTAVTAAIFWGTSWASYSGDKITGLDSWYGGFGGSNYAKTCTEYTGTNGQVSGNTSYAGHYVDTSAASGGSRTSAILAEVCKVISNPWKIQGEWSNSAYTAGTGYPNSSGLNGWLSGL
jgi:hypothetical protein